MTRFLCSENDFPVPGPRILDDDSEKRRNIRRKCSIEHIHETIFEMKEAVPANILRPFVLYQSIIPSYGMVRFRQ